MVRFHGPAEAAGVRWGIDFTVDQVNGLKNGKIQLVREYLYWRGLDVADVLESDAEFWLGKINDGAGYVRADKGVQFSFDVKKGMPPTASRTENYNEDVGSVADERAVLLDNIMARGGRRHVAYVSKYPIP